MRSAPDRRKDLRMRLSEADSNALSGAPAAQSYLHDGTTVMSWLNTRDHKRVGIMFLVSVLFFFFVGGLFALLIRFKLLQPGPFFVDALSYNRMFTLHGIVMIFLFLIPAIPSAFGNFVLPLMIGARDVAFPRLNLLSWYLYLIGAAVALWGMIHDGADTGWTFYTPYSSTTPTQVAPILLGAFILGFSSILTGLNFIVTVHTLRAPGLGWMKMPLFVWSAYATSVIQILATPVLAITLLIVTVERIGGFGLFDPARGGEDLDEDRKSTRLNSSHLGISYAVFCLKKKKTTAPRSVCVRPGRYHRPRSGVARCLFLARRLLDVHYRQRHSCRGTRASCRSA